MTTLRLVVSPGTSYADEMLAALADATAFTLVTGFASVAGVRMVEPALRAVIDRGGQGRIILAVDRQGFNAAAVFQSLLDLKAKAGARLSIGVVLEGAGLLHAKALFTQGPCGDQLLVGSANLTRNALGVNHEMGVLLGQVPSDVRRTFLQFVTSIAPRSLDGDDAETFLISRGFLPRHRTAPVPTARTPLPSIQQVIGKLPPLPPLPVAPEEHLAEWIARGYLLGKGRRTLDALVLRLPIEHLVKHGFIRAPQAHVLGPGSHETRTMGYGVDLIATAESACLRKDARRVSTLLSKLTLSLPCFGAWMPETYWDAFTQAREVLRTAGALAPGQVREAATRQREYLLQGGLEAETDRIIARLAEHSMLVPDRGTALRDLLLPRFRAEIGRRTPDILESCIEFRTARQRWTPYENTEQPYRQLMVDVVQGTFSATYRTGDWPARFRSHAARRVAESIEQRLHAVGREPTGEAATSILDRASTWEDPERPMSEVCEEFRLFVADDLQFPAPDVATLAEVLKGDDDVQGVDDDAE